MMLSMYWPFGIKKKSVTEQAAYFQRFEIGLPSFQKDLRSLVVIGSI
jgi:hypothetical protein